MFSATTLNTIRNVLMADPLSEPTDVDLVMDVAKKGRRSRALRLRAKEAAALLGISRVTLWRRQRSVAYKLTVIKDGPRSVFFLRDEIERYTHERQG